MPIAVALGEEQIDGIGELSSVRGIEPWVGPVETLTHEVDFVGCVFDECGPEVLCADEPVGVVLLDYVAAYCYCRAAFGELAGAARDTFGRWVGAGVGWVGGW